ncbi:hypothetical protein C1Y35_30250 [Pseudomonas sp. GW456-L14]|uniref:hypothetical protein n=1 Tax=unclassified Pseudomonas TaxID=196821 RepID=UPI000C88DC99|nr:MULTISPECIES: hypothetical protein [unclassified Pseudomonas]PMY31250.1 hypothetical protein C1Y35_30250 [Pseudomonas sp. GW456-L14]PMY48487.1 hypothetical protein C1Y34_30245 [Pseudomonas sp. GW456-L12]
MTPEERKEKFKSQTDSLYAGLGRFVVGFEELVATMRQMISLHVAQVPAPHQARQQHIANIFTADLTADPLARTFRSILLLSLESYGRQEQLPIIKDLLSNLCSRIDGINKKRNKFLHGTWHIDYASVDQEDFSEAKGFKATNTANGLRLDRLEHTADSFLEAVEECLALKDLVSGFSICLMFNEDLLKIYGFKDKKMVRLEVGNQ